MSFGFGDADGSLIIPVDDELKDSDDDVGVASGRVAFDITGRQIRKSDFCVCARNNGIKICVVTDVMDNGKYLVAKPVVRQGVNLWVKGGGPARQEPTSSCALLKFDTPQVTRL